MWEILVRNSRLDAIACICASPMVANWRSLYLYTPCSFFSRFLDVLYIELCGRDASRLKVELSAESQSQSNTTKTRRLEY